MKKIYSYMLLAMGLLSMTLTSCSDDDPISTATANDDPRIIDPVFPDRRTDSSPPSPSSHATPSSA